MTTEKVNETTETKSRPPRPPMARPAPAQKQLMPTAGRLSFRKPNADSIKPPKIVVNAVEGFGKTTIGAYAPKPAFLITGDTGYLTLASAGRVPQCDYVEIKNWTDFLAVLENLKNDEHETIVVDALGGMQELCFDHVCTNQYKSSRDTFLAYQAGPRNAAGGEWIKGLSSLEQTGKTIVLLSHAKIMNFKNPLDADYQRYTADLYPEVYQATARWADAVLFGMLRAIPKKDESSPSRKQPRFKPSMDAPDRVIFTERRDAWDAKNRYGMPQELDLNVQPEEMWSVIWNVIQGVPAEQ